VVILWKLVLRSKPHHWCFWGSGSAVISILVIVLLCCERLCALHSLVINKTLLILKKKTHGFTPGSKPKGKYFSREDCGMKMDSGNHSEKEIPVAGKGKEERAERASLVMNAGL